MNAIFTLLYNPDYIPGAILLGKKLLNLNDNFYRGIIIDKSKFTITQLKFLLNFYNELIDIEPIVSTDSNLSLLNRPELNKTWSKIQLWNLLKFNKILYLDCDTLPLNKKFFNLFNIDFPKNKILASPDCGFPDIFNSGVMVLKPNLNDYNNLINLIKFGNNISFDGADQGLLNQYFNKNIDWIDSYPLTQLSNWIKIPFVYNCTPSIQYQYLPAYNHYHQPQPQLLRTQLPDFRSQTGNQPQTAVDKQLDSITNTLNDYFITSLNFYQADTSIKLLHYIGPIKPWNCGDKSGIFDNWWIDWHQFFGNTSIHDAIYGEVNMAGLFADKLNQERLNLTEHQDEDGKQQQQQQPEDDVNVDNIPSMEPEFDPSYLLNPNNYVHFESKIVSENHWDPATQVPPSDEPHNQGFSDLEQGMKRFVNKWDETEIDSISENKSIEPEVIDQVLNQEEQKTQELSDPIEEQQQQQQQKEEIGIQQANTKSVSPESITQVFENHYVQPERVFTNEDYKPVHRLQPVEKIEIKPQKENFPQLSQTLYQDSTDYTHTQEKFIKEGILEDVDGFEQIYDEDVIDTVQTTNNSSVPKLFPWEFKSGAKTERVFD